MIFEVYHAQVRDKPAESHENTHCQYIKFHTIQNIKRGFLQRLVALRASRRLFIAEKCQLVGGVIVAFEIT